MKSSLLLKKCILAFIITASLSSIQADDSLYRIKPLRETKSEDLIKVGSSWLKCPERIQASLRTSADVPKSSIYVRAYFYDAGNHLVHTYKAPCDIWMNTSKGFEAVGLPKTLENGHDIDVFFALTDELEAKKWKTVLVVFGDSTTAVARSKPQTEISKLDFPEKAITKLEE